LAGVLGLAGFVALRAAANRAFRIEDLFLINREGLLIAHTTSRRDSHGDEDILAGMLTAIMSFAQDVFQEEIGGLKQFAIGNKTVALERSEHVYVAAIGSGPIRNRLSASLREFLADIEERYGDRLQWWSGMNEDLLGIDAMVQLFARRERYRRGDWKRHTATGTGRTTVETPEAPDSAIHVVIVPKEPLRPL
jgi:predicted regulator of Ras-like GTPase activity (Roadblock/LC7/MglB family)